MNIAFLLTSFNRKEKTLSCIRQLIAISLQAEANVDIYLVDDNSTDGTFDTVKKEYPSVFVTKTIGDYYWGRGMYVAWYEALKILYDAYIWVNDDNEFYNYALEEMLDCAKQSDYKAIICGTFCSNEGKITYGGADKKHKKISPTGKMENVYYMNGNFVLVPQYVVDKIGIIDPTFRHIKGDYDYGLRALEAGINVFTTTRFTGVSPQNPMARLRGRIPGRTIKERYYDSFHSPFLENPATGFYYNMKHGKGALSSFFLLIKSLLVILIPDFIYKSIHRV